MSKRVKANNKNRHKQVQRDRGYSKKKRLGVERHPDTGISWCGLCGGGDAEVDGNVH